MAALKMTRGDTPTIRVGPVVRKDNAGVDQLVNLTGASAKMTVRQSIGSAQLFQVVATFDVANGYILCKPSAANTLALAPGNYVYDVELTEADGTITTFPAKGNEKLVLQADVTHA